MTADRSSGFPFSDFQKAVISALDNLKGHVKHCARNAIYGLNKAWQIADIDPNIAIFRSITAEEEAATALIIALKQRQYKAAGALNYKDHRHKAGITPFINAIAKTCSPINQLDPKIAISTKDGRSEVILKMSGALIGRPNSTIDSLDPLDNLFFVGNRETGSLNLPDFEPAMKLLADDKGAESIAKFFDDEANLRNRLLYALPNGVWRVDKPNQMIEERTYNVINLLLLTIAVWQVRRPQMLAIHGLESYLKVLGLDVSDPFNFSEAIEKHRKTIGLS